MKSRLLVLHLALWCTNIVAADTYVPPAPLGHRTDFSTTVNAPIEETWTLLLKALDRPNISIDNADEATKSLNATFSGDPEHYIDCGTIQTTVLKGTAETQEIYPASRANIELMPKALNGTGAIHNTMALRTRAELKLTPKSDSTTRLTVVAVYNLTRVHEQSGQRISSSKVFSSSSAKPVPLTIGANPIRCRPTWKLEDSILQLKK